MLMNKKVSNQILNFYIKLIKYFGFLMKIFFSVFFLIFKIIILIFIYYSIFDTYLVL